MNRIARGPRWRWSPRVLALAGALLLFAVSPRAGSVCAQMVVQNPSMPGAYMPEMLPFGQTSATAALSCCTVGTYFRVEHTTGRGVGHASSYTNFGIFHPYWLSRSQNAAAYVDGQIVAYTDPGNMFPETGGLGANVGLGMRFFDDELMRMYGANIFYDIDGGYNPLPLHRMGVGFEYVTDIWDARLNGYFPFGGQGRVVGETFNDDPFFIGNNIAVERTQFVRVPLPGLDWEVGRHFPGVLGMRQTDLFAGGYYYPNNEGQDVLGFAGRLQLQVSTKLLLQFSATHDQVYDTNFNFNFVWLLPGGKPKTGGPPCTRLAEVIQPVRRNQNVVAVANAFVDQTLLVNQATELPFEIIHIDSAAAGPGDGTFENPFNTLADAETLAALGGFDIAYAHSGSVFDGESFALAPDLRFLGEGVDHFIDTVQMGTILLPEANGGTDLPEIVNAPGDAVILASGGEVSGFVIENVGGAGILADGFTGAALVHRNQLNDNATGILVQNSAGTITFEDNPIDGGDAGIAIFDSTGTYLFLGPTDVANTAASGLQMNGGSSTAIFEELHIDQNSTAIAMDIDGAGLTLQIDDGTINNGGGQAVRIVAAALDVALESVSSDGGEYGIYIENNQGSFAVTGNGATPGSGGLLTGNDINVFLNEASNVTLSNLDADLADTIGVHIVESNNITLNGMRIIDAGSHGLFVEESQLISVNNLLVADAAATSVRLTNNAGAIDFNNLTVENPHEGMFISGNNGPITFAGTTVVANAADDSVEILNEDSVITFHDLQIANATGLGLRIVNMTGGLVINDGFVSNANGNAVHIENVLNMNVTLESVSAAGGDNQVRLINNVGSFSVTGSGGLMGSGGTLNNAAFAGVYSTNGGSLNLAYIDINNPGQRGVDIQNGSQEVVVDSTRVAGAGLYAYWVDGASNVQLLDVTATNAATAGIRLNNNATNVVIDGATITNPATYAILSDEATNVTIVNSSINNPAAFEIAINLQNAHGDYVVSNNTMSGLADGVTAFQLSTATETNLTMNGNAFTLAGDFTQGIRLFPNAADVNLNGTVNNAVTADADHFYTDDLGNTNGTIIVNGVAVP